TDPNQGAPMLNRRCGRSARTILASLLFACTYGTALHAQQAIDEEYTAQIRQFTTEPFFLTPLVDHLPASATVPSPLKVLGHIAGAAEVLTYPEDVAAYMRTVDD